MLPNESNETGEMNIAEMSLSDLEMKLDELQERLQAEGLPEDERAQIEETIKAIQSQIEILATKAGEAAREAAGLAPAADAPVQ